MSGRVGGQRTAPLVMGVLNVTPDSFSDGGRWLHPDAAVRHGIELIDDGAAIVDVGGESTRPGAEPVAVDEELRRVIPVVDALARDGRAAVSVDTTKAAVAQAAIAAGATVVNDVSAGRFDPEMLSMVAGAGVQYVAMHMQGEPRTMQRDPHYDDVVREVGDFLLDRIAVATAAGVAPEQIVVDPGIGFGKTRAHNLALLAALPSLAARVGAPVLIGTSRKTFIGAVLDLPPDERDEGTLATVAWVAERGASIVRVHDVRSAIRTIALLNVMRRATPEGLAA